MTTKTLEVAGISTYALLPGRLKAIGNLSNDVHRRRSEFAIDQWSLTRFYHLLLERYRMPENEAKELIQLCEENKVNITELGGLLDEELKARFGNIVLPDKTLPYVSLALLEMMLGRSGYKATKELKRQLVPSNRKVKQA